MKTKIVDCWHSYNVFVPVYYDLRTKVHNFPKKIAGRPLKIVHALAYYGNYLGGIQHSVHEVSKRQMAMGHDVRIVTSDIFGNGPVVDGVTVKRLKTFLRAFRVPFVPSLPLDLVKENCDVLHVYLPLPWFDICSAFEKILHSEVKLVLSIRNLLPNSASPARKMAAVVHDNFTIRVGMNAANAIVFTNDEFASSVPYPVPRSKTFIVPNGVDTDVFHPNADYTHEENQVLFVGRLIPEKGLTVLMHAMKIVRAKCPEAKLVAVVSDYYNERRYLQDVLGLDQGFLELRSNLPILELAQLYRESTVFVLPSIGLESFGNVLVEAMASGCPVVGTDLPGPRGLILSGASSSVGIVVPRNDPEALAGAVINELRNDNNKRRGKIAEFAKRRISWDVVARQLISLYKKC